MSALYEVQCLRHVDVGRLRGRGLAGTQLDMPRADVHTHTLYTHSCSGDSPPVEINFLMALHQALKTSPHRPYQLDAQHYVITKAPTPTMDGPNKLQQYEDKKKKFFYVEGIHTISTLNTTKKHRITPAKSLGAL